MDIISNGSFIDQKATEYNCSVKIVQAAWVLSDNYEEFYEYLNKYGNK